MADQENAPDFKSLLKDSLTGVFAAMLTPNHEQMGQCDTHKDERLLKRDAFCILASAPEDGTLTLSLRDFQARDLSDSLEITEKLREEFVKVFELIELCDIQLKSFEDGKAPEDLIKLHQKLLDSQEEIKKAYIQIFHTNDVEKDLEKFLKIPSVKRLCGYIQSEVSLLEDLNVEERQDARIPVLVTETELETLGIISKLMLTRAINPNSPAIATMRVNQVLATVAYASEHAFLDGWYENMKALIEPDLGFPLDSIDALTPLALKWVECNGPLIVHAEFPPSDLDSMIKEGVSHRTKITHGGANLTYKGAEYHLSVSTRDIDKFTIEIRHNCLKSPLIDKEKILEVSSYIKQALENSLGVSFPPSASRYEGMIQICDQYMPEEGELMHVLDVLIALSKAAETEAEIENSDRPTITSYTLSYHGLLSTDPFVTSCLKNEKTTILDQWVFHYEKANGELDEKSHFLFEYLGTLSAHIKHCKKYTSSIEDGIVANRATDAAWKAAAEVLRYKS